MKRFPTRLGSTEAECYDELKCSDYCCKDKVLQLKAPRQAPFCLLSARRISSAGRLSCKQEDAAQLLGSTDQECCEKPS